MQDTQQYSTKSGAAIYDDETTKITATSPPVLESERCEHTGMWRLDLNPATSPPTTEAQAAPNETINVIFDLPSARKMFLWYHASAGFPTKATSIDAVRNGNYSTWPKLTVTLKYYLTQTISIFPPLTPFID